MSAPTVTTAHAPVVGDGTSVRSRSARRWRRARWPLGLLALVVVAGILSALPEPRTSTLTLAPDNPGDLGARAAAQIRGREGVDGRYVRHIAGVEALAAELVAAGRTFDDVAYGHEPATAQDEVRLRGLDARVQDARASTGAEVDDSSVAVPR